MRRKDREISNADQIEAILNDGLVCHLGMFDGELPYVVPLNYGYQDGYLYFHSAGEGRKVDIIRSSGYVCFQIETDLKLVKAERASGWSMKYRSVMGYGHIEELSSDEERLKALLIIMKHYSGSSEWELSAEELRNVLVLRLRVEEITGKKS